MIYENVLFVWSSWWLESLQEDKDMWSNSGYASNFVYLKVLFAEPKNKLGVFHFFFTLQITKK